MIWTVANKKKRKNRGIGIGIGTEIPILLSGDKRRLSLSLQLGVTLSHFDMWINRQGKGLGSPPLPLGGISKWDGLGYVIRGRVVVSRIRNCGF